MTRTTTTSAIVAIAVGAVLALAGLAVGGAGGILFGVFGSDGTVASGSHPLSTPRPHLSRRWPTSPT
jgi:hypothetical protein